MDVVVVYAQQVSSSTACSQVAPAQFVLEASITKPKPWVLQKVSTLEMLSHMAVQQSITSPSVHFGPGAPTQFVLAAAAIKRVRLTLVHLSISILLHLAGLHVQLPGSGL